MKRKVLTIILSLAAACSTATFAAPDGFSINSDSGSNDADSLYRIDLATGVHTRLGKVQSLGNTKIDVEGLAFAPDGTLYGVDDDSLTLFPINSDNGVVSSQQEVKITGLPSGGSNDFGLTFACDGNLYATSVSTGKLYRIGLDGVAAPVGSLGTNLHISALAAYGNPVQLYGLGNGLTAAGAVDSRTLYSINPQTGVATARPNELGAAANSYTEAGLSFDNDNQLWAITDRRSVAGGPFVSQIIRINTTTGIATHSANTQESGFESLAITVPRGCATGNGKTAEFVVQKRFVDGNNVSPVTLNLSCNTGLPLNQTVTVVPNAGPNGQYEVDFIVESFDDGQLTCTVTEAPLAGYTPSYTCLGESTCQAAQSAASCVFSNVAIGSENLCQVQNYPNPVQVTIKKEWRFEAEELGIIDTTRIELECTNAYDGNGESGGHGMLWNWKIKGNTTVSATVYPDFDGTTHCRVQEFPSFSAIEAENSCADWFPVAVGQGTKSCVLINTVFLEGIPTLNAYGLLLIILLMLSTGLIAVRRI